jgi:hypothetical protein
LYVQEELSHEQKKRALSKIPSLLEVAGYTYFPASFLVGPQFPMRRYLDFVAGIFRDEVEVQQCVCLCCYLLTEVCKHWSINNCASVYFGGGQNFLSAAAILFL